MISMKQFRKKYSDIQADYEDIGELLTAIEYGNRKAAMLIYDTMMKKWKMGREPLLSARVNIQEIMLSLSALLRKYGSSMYNLSHAYMDIFNRIWSVNSYQRLTEICLVFAGDALEYIDTIRNERKESVVLQIKRYVDSHMTEPLTLAGMAEQYYMNAAYLSRAFKKEVGINFNDYLKKIRMNRAVSLLKTTDMKIYEIAKETGYENSNYFMKIFREVYGVTPGQYKENGL